MSRKRWSLGLLAALVALPVAAQIQYHPNRIPAASVPTCDATWDAYIISITDASSATDCTTTGGGSDVALCQCDNGTGWESVRDGAGSGSPAGADSNVQYNNSGAFGGEAALAWDDTNDELEVTGSIVLNASSPVGSAAFSIDGSSDQIQALIQSHSTQSSDVLVIEKSNGSDALTVNNDGIVTIYAGGSPATSGNVQLPNNTGIGWRNNADNNNFSLSVTTGDVFRMDAGLTVNADLADSDTQISGSGEADLIYADAGNDRVGLGTSSPSVPVHIYNATANSVVRVESGDANVVLELEDPTNSWNVGHSGGIFQVGDVTNAKTPFRIEPNAATDSLYVDASGNTTVGALLYLWETDTPGTCDAGARGSMYYDISEGHQCVCDGSNWVDGVGTTCT